MSPVDPERGHDTRPGVELCPHCRLWHDGKIITHCLDKERWTQAERDELHARHMRQGIPMAPSSEQMQARFGARNRADMLREASDVSR